MMILELHRQGLSVTAIARRTGRDPKTVRLVGALLTPEIGRRVASAAGSSGLKLFIEAHASISMPSTEKCSLDSSRLILGQYRA